MHATICDYLADIVQNSIEAGAARIQVEMTETESTVSVTVTDNGQGMDAATQARIWDPFYSEPGKHARRRVGLGLPLLRQAVEATGGELRIESAPGAGTVIGFALPARHLDTPPLGDLSGTLLGLLAHDGDYDLMFTRARGRKHYAVSRAELSGVLGDLREAGNLALARDFLRGQEDDLIQTTHDDAAGLRPDARCKETHQP